MFNHNLVNAQGDTFNNAVVIVSSIDSIEETTQIKRKRFTIGNNDQYSMEVQADEQAGPLESIEYQVKYYSDGAKRQQGRLPYVLTDKQGNATFEFELDEKLAEMYDKAGGTEAQKLVFVCEYHLKNVVLPSLR